MGIELENLSKQELLALIKKQSKTISIQEKTNIKIEGELEKQKEKNAELEYLVELLKRMKFGQSRERFEDPNQTKLPLEVQAEVLQEQ
ncbi:IS66 family transposase, partial [Myroides sp. LJL115]